MPTSPKSGASPTELSPGATQAVPPFAWKKVPRLPRAATITKVTIENYRTKTFVLEATIEAQPGQFVMVWLPGSDEIPISLVAARPLTLTATRVGTATEALWELREGQTLHFRGPCGNAFPLAGERLLLVGGGYGVAPLYFLAQEALAQGKEVQAIIGARTAAELLFEERFASLGLHPIVTTDDGSRGFQGLATDAAQRLLDQQPVEVLYSCGPEAMMKRLGEIAAARGLPCYLSVERYMKCGGMSLCGACELNGLLLCAEGPVFPYHLLKNLPDFGLRFRDATAAKRLRRETSVSSVEPLSRTVSGRS